MSAHDVDRIIRQGLLILLATIVLVPIGAIALGWVLCKLWGMP